MKKLKLSEKARCRINLGVCIFAFGFFSIMATIIGYSSFHSPDNIRTSTEGYWWLGCFVGILSTSAYWVGATLVGELIKFLKSKKSRPEEQHPIL